MLRIRHNDGGGIYCLDSVSTVCNTILWADKALVNGDEIYLDTGGSITVTYSDVAGGWEGEGNMDENPLFVGFNDYHLQAGSMCIDAGTPDGAPPDDIEGNPRDEFPDMGAYEFQPSGDTGVINGTVTEKGTGEPIAKAIVIAVNIETKEKSIAFTDGNGDYEIPDLQPGIYLVICIKKEYNPGIGKVVVEAGKTTTHDFKLVPK
ncbi:carboxypeptidase regulatory-like domain-containing protein [bacterium]|nr:carboxypeptidase regulatory-like domain-containing protein [bacterium]